MQAVENSSNSFSILLRRILDLNCHYRKNHVYAQELYIYKYLFLDNDVSRSSR